VLKWRSSVAEDSEPGTPSLGDCRAAISQLSQRYDWSLIAPEEWAERALQHLQHGEAPTPVAAVLLCYSHQLYRACAGQRGVALQNRGYTEVAHYLTAAAAQRYPDLLPDVTQRALLRIYEQLGECQSPATFLAFAFQQLRSAARDERGGDHAAIPIPNDILDQIPDTTSLDQRILDQESAAAIRRLFDTLVKRHPRASDQLAAVRMKYLDGLDDATIAAVLKTTIPNVQVLRSRGKKRLLSTPELQQLFLAQRLDEPPRGDSGDLHASGE
jgi:RNA polymerase sigma factor (sigma-70 family)